MTPSTLILVAHRAGARFFTQQGTQAKPALLETIAHPEGRLREHDLDADEGGRVHDRMGGHRHAVAPEHSATEHLAEGFARTLAEKLKANRESGHYERIVLVADPRTLGRLRTVLDPFTAERVTRSLDKDLGAMPEAEVVDYLYHTLRQ